MDWNQSRRKSRRAKLPGSRKRRRSTQREHVPLRFKFDPAPVPYKFAPAPVPSYNQPALAYVQPQIDTANPFVKPLSPQIAAKTPMTGNQQSKNFYDQIFEREVVPFLQQTVHKDVINAIKDRLDSMIIELGASKHTYIHIARKGFPQLLSMSVADVNNIQTDHIATKLSVHGMNKEQADALLGRNLAAAAPVPPIIPFGM
jgi:hypothetical protein